MGLKELVIAAVITSVVMYAGLTVTVDMMESKLPDVIRGISRTCNLCLQQFPDNCTWNSTSDVCTKQIRYCEQNCTIMLV